MKTPVFILRLALAGLLFAAFTPRTTAVVFTSSTVIGSLDTNYDGANVVISNCTVTVDGAHTFASLRVAPGGTLTHLFWANGLSTGLEFAYNEPQVLTSTNPMTLLHTNAYGPVTVKDASQTITYSNGVDYMETDLPNGTVQIARTETSSIPDGATVLVSYSWNYITPAGLNLTVTGDVVVASGGSINANGIGYGGAPSRYLGIGPGSGSSSGGTFFDGSGGGHGGNGGMSSSNAVGGACYDSLYQPILLGSGGGASYAGPGANGGGAIHIAATGNVDIDGVVSANGADASYDRAGGGAGGSVWIIAASVSGAGSISADGGAGAPMYGGGGGGGRIAIQCGTNTISGTMTAYGGSGFQTGGAGTIFTQITGQNGLLVVDNGGRAGTNSTVTLPTLADVIIRGNAGVAAGSPFNSSNLTVSARSVLTAPTQGALTLSVAGNMTIQAGGVLTLDGLGYGGGSGSGAGQIYFTGNYYFGGGGGHGGYGAAASVANATGGSAYDSQATPTLPGSGGGNNSTFAPVSIGGAGGGAMQLTVAGNLQVDGNITANGLNGSGIAGGGGSGGGLEIYAAVLAGSGSVTANGGNGAGSFGGGGGGGRIAIVAGTNLFTGKLAATGGGGANRGGAGTLYLQAGGAAPELLLDNAGQAGAITPLQAAQGANLIVQNSAVGLANSGLSFGSLLVGSNAWLMASNANLSQTLDLTVSGNATIQSGSGLIADGGGYAANNGPGHGSYYPSQPNYPGGGGGHGGYGAAWSGTNIGGGTTYDTIAAPTTAGSGGGGYSPYSIGGSGGGAMVIIVSGALQVDGVLSANGGNGSGNGGGGSGGSLNFTVGSLLGSGVFAANGGNGVDGVGGGGGGGMIAASFSQTNSFTGTISACGGSGANYGGAGTIYIRTNSLNQPLLIVDNAGHRGTNTPILSTYPPISLIIRNGAAASVSQQTVANLLITSNAWLVPGNNISGTVNLTVNGNATIQAGGGIVTDATGNPQNSGPGPGHGYGNSPWYPCSGAGHGGYGAFGFTNQNQTPGGITYDSTASPNNAGSGGGGYGPYSSGGGGGGYVRLQVTGVLQLDGVISANGGNGTGSGGGGGSGGSIYLSIGRTGAFSGAGSITANGGNGANAIGGGGGGGRLAIYTLNNPGYPPLTNSFTGVLSAYGGGGWQFGGAGTIYFQTNGVGYPLLLLDNANHAGTNTSFDFLSLNATIQNGAVGLLPVSGGWAPINLLVRTNGVLTAPASGSMRTVSANTVTIEAGGAISLDGSGYSQSGPGNGLPGSNSRGGGGHGGYGGGNPTGGGATYDSIQSPAMAGSSGASYNSGPPYSYGGTGGGALSLSVFGTLTVNGRLSANGLSGGYNSGGGSGGSLNLSAFNLAGSGVISTAGGAASGAAGGGGGGRITLVCTNDNFTGQFSAIGGNATYPGGAGTIYTSASGAQALLVDNGGLAGTNTPLSSAYSLPATPFNLDISGGAVAVPFTPLPLLSNLNLATGSTLTVPVAQSNLFLAVLNNANLAGTLNVDHLGYAQGNGPGAGSAISSKGSGGGYGGAGGASSSAAAGGASYGSATEPVDFGSGGGDGAATANGGSDGGGALHLAVAGALSVNGNVSANGDAGLQDDSGGGAGGSVWISAGSLSGAGNISALGGAGAALGGGGGGGGRIAIYTPTNNFAGTTSARGGGGWSSGQGGTILLSGAFSNFQIESQSPTGLVMNVVSWVDLGFNDAVDPASVSASNFALVTPAGVLAASNLTAAATGPATVRVSFPAQNLLGNYTIQAATAITNIFGLPLASAYAGTFTVSLPAISGAVTDTNGAPVAGVLLQPSGGLTGVTTGANGQYALGVPPGWSGTVTPGLGNFMFVPGSIACTNVTAPLTNQNYLMVTTIAPGLVPGVSGTDFRVNWAGLPGVTYQLLWSTNLVNWQPLGSPLPGTNGPMQFVVPIGSDPADFFRVSATE